MIAGLNKKGEVICKIINNIEHKLCSKCSIYYPKNTQYYHLKDSEGNFISRCKKCTNKSNSFENNSKPARSVHWQGNLLICATCKLPKTVDNFKTDKRNKFRAFKNNSCTTCYNTYCNKRLQVLYIKNDLDFYITRLYNGITHRCRNIKRYKDLEFDITKQDLLDLYKKQKGKCAISGEIMTNILGKNVGQIPTNISVDRIDSNNGYTKSNIQLVCTTVNIMKSNMTLEMLKYFCKLIIQHT